MGGGHYSAHRSNLNIPDKLFAKAEKVNNLFCILVSCILCILVTQKFMRKIVIPSLTLIPNLDFFLV